MKTLNIKGIANRFFRLLKLFNKTKKSYILFSLPMNLLLISLDIGSLLAIAPFLIIVVRPSIIKTNEIFLLIYNFFNFSSDKYFIVTLGICSIFIFIISKIAFFTLTLLQKKIGQTLTVDLSEIVFDKLFGASQELHFLENTSTIHNSIRSQCIVCGKFLSNCIFASSIFIILLGILVYSFIEYFLVFFFPVLFIFVFGYLYYRFTKKISYGLGKSMSINHVKAVQVLKESIVGIVDIKLLNKENYYKYKYLNILKSENNTELKISAIQTAVSPFLHLLLYTSILIQTLYIIFFFEDSFRVLLSSAFFIVIAYRGIPYYNNLMGLLSEIQNNLFYIDDLNKKINLFKEVETINYKPITFNRKISLQNASYSYPNAKKNIFSKINFEIEKGDCIGIIGETGSGKTTLVRILLGILNLQKGKMLIDNQIFSKEYTKSWYQKIAFVSQRSFISKNSLIKNIALGEKKKEIDQKKLKQILNQPWLKSFIKTLPNGAETEIQDDGINLSGGQIQRIAIARALYKSAEVLFFDEATNSLDLKTEKLVISTIDSLPNKKTLIIIAHRLTTLKKCNKIYNISGGKIIFYNGYKEMLKNTQND